METNPPQTDNKKIPEIIEDYPPPIMNAVSEASGDVSFLLDLERIIDERKKELPEGSYVTHLFEKGLDRIIQKVGEEGVEVVIAAKNNNPQLFKEECADLIFHLLVLCREKDLSLEELVQEIEKRHK